jgi:transcription antitermination factor NusG
MPVVSKHKQKKSDKIKLDLKQKLNQVKPDSNLKSGTKNKPSVSKLNGKAPSKFGFLLSLNGKKIDKIDLSIPKWVVIELTFAGEREKDLNALKASAQKLLNCKSEVFIPAIFQKVRNESHTIFYLDGYMFIKYEEGVNYLKLQETTYFKSILHKVVRDEYDKSKKRIMLTLLDDSDLNSMRSGMKKLQIASFQENDDVKIIQGEYKGLQAKVIYLHENGETVQVKVDLRSKKILFDFPSSYLMKMENQM